MSSRRIGYNRPVASEELVARVLDVYSCCRGAALWGTLVTPWHETELLDELANG
jgi:hypothetical protein